VVWFDIFEPSTNLIRVAPQQGANLGRLAHPTRFERVASTFGGQRSALAKCADLFAVQVQRNSRVERDHLGYDRSQAGRVRSFFR
jgi:hypothetical protein